MKFATPVTEEVSINLTPLIDIVFLGQAGAMLERVVPDKGSPHRR